MRMHKNILGGGHLLGNNSPVARRHRCAGAGRPLPTRGSRRVFRLATTSRLLVTTASFALVLLVGALLFPATPDAVHAEETGTKATLTINPVLSLGLDSAVTMSVQPTSTGEFTSGSAELTVSTNNETGYSLYLSTANGKATLDSINPATTTAVQPVSGTVAADGFGANTWGYNLGKDAATDSTTYQAVPTTATAPQATTAGPTLGDGALAADTYNLNFGALINSDLPSGTYTNTVTVSVVANPAYVPNLTQISNMQDMTTEICNASTVGQTNRLTDTRDGKLYWVAKLADNQCWMTQNLDLDLSTDTALTPDDSDVSANWTPAMSTQTTLSSGEFTSGTDGYNGVRSYDPGLYVNDPSKGWTACNAYYEDTSACTDGNWTKITDSMSPMTTERTDGTVVDGNTYDAHYLVGNYYQFNTATAGTGASVTTGGDNALSSICPKGWKLPTSGNSDLGSFAHLTSGISTGSTLSKAPYYFIPAGYAGSGSLNTAGSDGYYWSSTAASSGYAYYLYFGLNSVYPSVSYGQDSGFPVRCLAR